MIMFGRKKETAEEWSERRKKVLLDYFKGEAGQEVFRLVIENSKKEDKGACPIDFCPILFAKGHDKDFPNFFVNPCWEMHGCLCILRKNGCDNCYRKVENNPLC